MITELLDSEIDFLRELMQKAFVGVVTTVVAVLILIIVLLFLSLLVF